MAFFGCLKTFVLTFTLTVVALMYAPGIPPYEADFVCSPLPPVVPLEGGLAVNRRLDKAEMITTKVEGSNLGYIKGAESFAFRDGYLYTGILGGDIVRLDLNKGVKEGVWQTVAKMRGGACNHEHEEADCGHVLGLAFDRWGFLLACDPYRGLVRVDVATGQTEDLVPSTQVIEGKRNLITNSLAVTADGSIIYFTSSSAHFTLKDAMFEALSSGSGRLLKRDTAKNETVVLVDGINFANGLVLSPKEDYLLVNECGRGKIWKYHLPTGEWEVFARLPGCVDNMSSNGKGGILVGIPFIFHPDDEARILERIISSAPLARLAVRLMKLTQMLLDLLYTFVPNDTIHLLSYYIGHSEHTGALLSKRRYGLVVELNDRGEVTQSWHSPEGSIKHICEGFLHEDGFMYLGSPYNKYIARVPYE